MSNSSWVYVRRGVVQFATGAVIPAGATINRAYLYAYVRSKAEDRAYSIQIQTGQPTYPHSPPVYADYDKDHYAGDGGSLAIGSVPASGWFKIELNATGIGWIQKGSGTTKLCLRSTLDIAGSMPATWPSSEECDMYGASEANAPYLEIWTT